MEKLTRKSKEKRDNCGNGTNGIRDKKTKVE
jgi:hypothetical protein